MGDPRDVRKNPAGRALLPAGGTVYEMLWSGVTPYDNSMAAKIVLEKIFQWRDILGQLFEGDLANVYVAGKTKVHVKNREAIFGWAARARGKEIDLKKGVHDIRICQMRYLKCL